MLDNLSITSSTRPKAADNLMTSWSCLDENDMSGKCSVYDGKGKHLKIEDEAECITFPLQFAMSNIHFILHAISLINGC